MFSSFLFAASLLFADMSDTLNTVTVVADRGVVVSRTDTAKIKAAVDIQDVLNVTPELYSGDCGGIAGLKSANMRGLGSAHTAIYLDGVRVGNVQSGQTDLGMLPVENAGSMVIDYAQNSLSFNTVKPVFSQGRPVAGTVRFSGGSFGTYLPYARMDFRLGRKVSLSANAAGVFSKGNFKYSDSLERANNDIRQIRGGLDLFGIMDEGNYHAKVYCNSAERGTPGPVDSPSSARQKDLNFFAQGVLHRQFGSLYFLSVSAKGGFDDIVYTYRKEDNAYRQTEFQLNSSHRFDINSWFTASLAADARWDGLKSAAYTQSRWDAVAAATAAFHLQRFRADLAFQYEAALDKGGRQWNCISPSLDMRFTAFNGFDLVAFARRAYRIPTFNELYYVGYGNPDLKDEDAILTDLGFDWNLGCGAWSFGVRADGFYDYIKNRIVSAPSPEDPDIWRPYNVGLAQIAGADVQVKTAFNKDALNVSFVAKYSYQNAVDRTPGGKSYGEQIPFIARHTFSANVEAGYRGWSLTATWNLRAGRRDSYGDMPDWNTLDMTFGKNFNLGGDFVLGLKLTARNLTDARYEQVTGYPMPGRSFYGGIDFKF